MKLLSVSLSILLVICLAACGAHYQYACTNNKGQTVNIEIQSLRDVEKGAQVKIKNCGQDVTIETSGLDNGHSEAQQIAGAIVPLAKAAAAAGGVP